MTYIVLELFPQPYIIQNLEGEVWITTDLDLAKETAEECQKGMVVPLDTALIGNLEWIYAYQKNIEETIKYYVDEQNTTT